MTEQEPQKRTQSDCDYHVYQRMSAGVLEINNGTDPSLREPKVSRPNDGKSTVDFFRDLLAWTLVLTSIGGIFWLQFSHPELTDREILLRYPWQHVGSLVAVVISSALFFAGRKPYT